MIHLFSELGPALIKDAPTIATALFSPAAGLVVKLLCDTFNSADPNDIVNTLKSDPTAEDRLKSLEFEHGDAIKRAMGWTWPSSIDINIKLNWGSPKEVTRQ